MDTPRHVEVDKHHRPVRFHELRKRFLRACVLRVETCGFGLEVSAVRGSDYQRFGFRVTSEARVTSVSGFSISGFGFSGFYFGVRVLGVLFRGSGSRDSGIEGSELRVVGSVSDTCVSSVTGLYCFSLICRCPMMPRTSSSICSCLVFRV
jgi:hypothetical protein